MSSRGHNHPSYCSCGFCQSRGQANENQVTTDLISVVGKPYSYTIPIPCPICGSAVFLYQSEHGGKVFFDELGPPWSKHPCTNRARAAPLTASDQPLPTRRYAWQEAGWLPVTDVRVERISSTHLRLSGTHNAQLLTVYIQVTTFPASADPVAEIVHSPIHARKTVDGALELAFLTQDLRPGLIEAFTQPPPR